MKNIIASEKVLPSEFSERLGLLYSAKGSTIEKKEKGQFFTPILIARYKSSLSTTK
jgi:hypothetical protein